MIERDTTERRARDEANERMDDDGGIQPPHLASELAICPRCGELVLRASTRCDHCWVRLTGA